jgi:hypothetical protein
MKAHLIFLSLSLMVLQSFGVIISNGVPAGTVGYFAVDIENGARSRDGWIGTGTNLGDVEFIFDYFPYYSITGGFGMLFAGIPAATGSNTIMTTGNLSGPNGIVNYQCVSYIPTNEMVLIQTWTFSSTNPFGNIRFIQYLDEDVFDVSDDILVPLGSYFDNDLELYTIDDATRIGTFQSIYSNDERNVSWTGWSADQYSDLKYYIEAGTAIFAPDGYIETNNLPPIPGTSPQEYGKNDVTSAVAYDLNSNAFRAILTVVLGGTPVAQLPADAVKIHKLKVKDKGAGKSGFQLKAGYNWSGKLPVTDVQVIIGSYTNTFALTQKGKKFTYKDSNYTVTLLPKKHLVMVKAKKINPLNAGTNPEVALGLMNTGTIFEENRVLTLTKGKYGENKNLAVPLFYLDKGQIKDTGKTDKDKIKLTATLNGTTVGTGTGVKIAVSGEGGTVAEEVIPAGSFSGKGGSFTYKRAKGATTPVKLIKISSKKKTMKIMLDNFNIPGAAITIAHDPLVSVKVSVDLPNLVGGGTVLVRFNQKKAGKMSF